MTPCRPRTSPVAAPSEAAGPQVPVSSSVPSPTKHEKDMSFSGGNGQPLLPISPKRASTRYPDADSLLTALNDVFRTHISKSYPGLERTLDHLKDEYDFGNIYARLRMIWPRNQRSKSLPNLWVEFSGLIQELTRRVTKHEEDRRSCLVEEGSCIRDPHLVQPRRIWDLYAHRVVPFTFIPEGLQTTYHAVSHSWSASMQVVDSDVNGHEWPIPIPRGVTLELVRGELLEKHAKFAWLDVVCLRQRMEDKKHPKYDEREKLLAEEWKIDIPTIGNLYNRCRYVVRYFNGLGVPFSRGTLQEVGAGKTEYIDIGLPRERLLITSTDTEGPITLAQHLNKHAKELETTYTPTYYYMHFEDDKSRIRGNGTSILAVICAMRVRHARNPVDKISGLSVLLGCSTLPVYLPNEEPEIAWKRLIDRMDGNQRMELFCAFQRPGDAGCYWHPSWAQVMAPSIKFSGVETLPGKLQISNGGVSYDPVIVIEGCELPTMQTSDTDWKTGRCGSETFTILPTGQEIQRGVYVLITGFQTNGCVVCKRGKSSQLEKVSVIQVREPLRPEFNFEFRRSKVAFC